MAKLIFILSIFLYVDSVSAGDKEISDDAVFVSPNGVYFVDGSVRIRDSKNGRLWLVPIMPPIYSLNWAKDSQSFVVVSHISNGTFATIVHFDGAKWDKYEAEPPGFQKYPFLNYSVREVRIDKVVALSYEVNTKMHSAEQWKSFICSFVVNPGDNKISKLKVVTDSK